MSKYFTEDEMVCHCCGALPPHGIAQELYDLLDDIRTAVGVPLNVNCAYRCPGHNAEVGGVPNSQHVDGTAADLDATGIGVEVLARAAETAGADGVGRYFDDNFVHVDIRSGRVCDTFRW